MKHTKEDVKEVHSRCLYGRKRKHLMKPNMQNEKESRKDVSSFGKPRGKKFPKLTDQRRGIIINPSKTQRESKEREAKYVRFIIYNHSSLQFP